jgi:hypothetical protein
MEDFQLLSRFLVGGAFALAGTLKALSWSSFRDTLAATELTPRHLVGPVAAFLVLAETLIGASLLSGWRVALAGRFALVLLVIFVVGLGRYWWRGGKRLVCGCFADFERTTRTVVIITRNFLLIIWTFPLLGQHDAERVPSSWLGWGFASVVALGLVMTWALLSQFADIVDLLTTEKIPQQI